MTAKVNSLADRAERMATKEELGQLHSEVATQVQATGQLNQSFDTLYQHVYHCCLKLSTDTMIGILSSPLLACIPFAKAQFHSLIRLFLLQPLLIMQSSFRSRRIRCF